MKMQNPWKHINKCGLFCVGHSCHNAQQRCWLDVFNYLDNQGKSNSIVPDKILPQSDQLRMKDI